MRANGVKRPLIGHPCLFRLLIDGCSPSQYSGECHGGKANRERGESQLELNGQIKARISSRGWGLTVVGGRTHCLRSTQNMSRTTNRALLIFCLGSSLNDSRHLADVQLAWDLMAERAAASTWIYSHVHWTAPGQSQPALRGTTLQPGCPGASGLAKKLTK